MSDWVVVGTFVVLMVLVFVGYIRDRRWEARLGEDHDRAVRRIFLDMDEKVLLGPVSAWVAEGEARAIYEWTAERSTGKQPIILGPGVQVTSIQAYSSDAPSLIIKAPDHRAAHEALHGYYNRPTKPDCDACDWVEDSALGDVQRHYIRGYACDRHRPQPDLPDPFREAEYR